MEAEPNSLSYHEFLSMLSTDELDLRASRRTDRLLHYAHLGAEMTLETWDPTFNASINAKLIRNLASYSLNERGEGIFLIGPTGNGKTHLAKAIAHKACRMMFSVDF